MIRGNDMRADEGEAGWNPMSVPWCAGRRRGQVRGRPDERYADVGRLVITCPDRPGIVAAVSQFLFEAGANITESQQYSTDPFGGMRRLERHVERAVLARAVGWHLEDRVIVHQNSTIVFS
jgi:formyltetrahydrofolate hydrolase